jgi:poly-gamma-glutamate capsule biosynthesis protein CapA/YwtB (metallophosphatase superfamily)
MSATLVVAGDYCAAGSVGAALRDPAANPPWNDVRPINEGADFSVVNLECPLTESPEPILKSGLGLWGPIESAASLREAGFTAVSLANNHVLDAGPSGLQRTLEVCRDAGLMCVGAGATHALATTPLTVTVGDVRLSLLAFAENEFSTTTGPRPGAWPLDLPDNARQIAQARSASDFVLVLLHGGAEQYPLPSPGMQKRCRFFVDMGADAVVCHHTHVASGYEFYNERPIVYGLGNLLFDSMGETIEGWSTGCVARVRVGHQSMPELELVPYHQDPTKPSITILTGQERDAFEARLSELNSIVADDARLSANWSVFCRTRRFDFLSWTLCLTHPEAWLLDKGLLPAARLRFTHRRLAALWNVFSCESHAESCQQILRDMLEKKSF